MFDLTTQLRERAAKNPKRIVYPEASDSRILRAVAQITAMKMAKPVLVGVPDVIEKKVQELRLRLSHVEIVDPRSRVLIDRYAALMLPNWKSRGVTEIEAKKR